MIRRTYIDYTFWENLDLALLKIWLIKEIALVALSQASYKIVIIFNIMRQEFWRNRVIITKSISVVMIHVYVEIAKNIYHFFVYINFFKGYV